MIYITGDTHGTYDVNKLAKIKPHLTEDDYVIVLGDFGVCWDNNGSDLKVRRFWERNKATTLFVDGNHENFDLLNALPVAEWNGGKVHRIGEKIIHLMRGQMFELDGKTIFTMGGAPSHDCGSALIEFINAHLDDYHAFFAGHDKMQGPSRSGGRVPGKSWWAAEIPTQEELSEAKANLAKANNKVDYILTHTAPTQILASRGLNPNESPQASEMMSFFEWLEQNVEFNNWWFGHLHEDFYYDMRHIGFYEQIREMY